MVHKNQGTVKSGGTRESHEDNVPVLASSGQQGLRMFKGVSLEINAFFLACAASGSLIFACYKLFLRPLPWWRFFLGAGHPVLNIAGSLLCLYVVRTCLKDYQALNRPSLQELRRLRFFAARQTACEAAPADQGEQERCLRRESKQSPQAGPVQISRLLWLFGRRIRLAALLYLFSLVLLPFVLLVRSFHGLEQFITGLCFAGDFAALLSLLFLLLSFVDDP